MVGGLSILLGMATSASQSIQAQSPPFQSSQMQPVPRTGQVRQAERATANPTRQGWNLKWRRSHQVATEPTDLQEVRENTVSASQREISRQIPEVLPASGSLQVPHAPPELQPVSPAAYLMTPQRPESPLDGQAPAGTHAPKRDDYFNNPFGDDPAAQQPRDRQPLAQQPRTQQPSQQTQTLAPLQDDAMLFPAPGDPAPAASPALPSEHRPMNDLRGSLDTLDSEEALFDFPSPDPEPTPSLRAQPDEGPSLGDMLKEASPDSEKPDSPSDLDDDAEALPEPDESSSKKDSQDDEFENPFGKRGRNDSDWDKKDRDRLNRGDDRSDDRSSNDNDFENNQDDELKETTGLSCNDFRSRIQRQTIDQVSLDISPPYRPDEIDQSRYDKLKNKFDEKQAIRQWRNIQGMPMTTGRLRDLAYEKAVIETEYGSIEQISIDQLSEADLAYLSENWGLPQECRLEQVAHVERTWTPMTMTWKASNLCHNPLYFEDVNLERYGHTRGPVLEPLFQTAHFFGNIAVLPYKMGVHCPTECQYSLGYYRPGNCAPWIIPPVPLSLKGAYSQAAVMTGMFWMIP